MLLDAILARFRWYRRLRGGHWERWFVDYPVLAEQWQQVEHDASRLGTLRRGIPTCEDWS